MCVACTTNHQSQVQRFDTRYARNEAASKVEADVAMCPLLSLFRREENRDGDTYVPYALHSYRSTATPFAVSAV